MRNIIFLLLTALVALQALWADGPTLLGTVRDRHTGKAVSSASVQIVDGRGVQLGTALSNSLGQWRFTIPMTGIHEGEVPRTFSIDQNYPNPFNPSTKIPFSVGHEGPVRIIVYNILGQLLDAREFLLRPGSYTIDWNAKGSAGVLFYSIEMDNVRLTKKMVQLDGGNRNGLGNILQVTRTSYSRVSMTDMLTDSCRVITSSLVYETDTTTVALVDSARVDVLLDSIHDRAFVIDLHNDVMEVMSGSNFSYQLSVRHTFTRNGDAQTDIPRYRDGGVDGQVFSIWIDPNAYAAATYFSTAMKFLDSLKAQAKRNSNDMGLVVRADSVDSNNRQTKISGIVVVEGGHCIEEKLANLLAFYNAGVRVMTITWKNSTSWAVSDQDSRAGTVGLNDFGKQVIRTMDSLGMVIDVSHVGRKTITDILATSTKPIIASHSGVYALCNNARNLPDSLILAIAARGGVMGIVFYPYYLTGSKSATLENVLQHIDYSSDKKTSWAFARKELNDLVLEFGNDPAFADKKAEVDALQKQIEAGLKAR
jgi:membrane dipeptidase